MTLDKQLYGGDRHDVVTIAGTPPGAGNNFSYLVPANSVMQVIAVTCRLTTSAVVADRWVGTLAGQGALLTQHNWAPAVQTASSACIYSFSIGVAPMDMRPGMPNQKCALPCCLTLRDDPVNPDALWIVVNNKDAGDVIDAIVLRYYQWKLL